MQNDLIILRVYTTIQNNKQNYRQQLQNIKLQKNL